MAQIATDAAGAFIRDEVLIAGYVRKSDIDAITSVVWERWQEDANACPDDIPEWIADAARAVTS